MESAPKDINNKNKIKALLETGARVSVKSTWQLISTTELRTYLSQLRKDGLVILSEWVQKGDFHFKEYWLAPKAE